MRKLFKRSELEIKKKPIGLALSLTNDNIAFFQQTFTTEQKYRTNVMNLLLTLSI